MKLGCPVWTIRLSPPYESAIERIARLGFKGVELIAWDKKTLDKYYKRRRTKKLRELVDSLGMEITEFASTPRNMNSAKTADREKAFIHFEKLVEVASDIGTKIVNNVTPWPFAGVPEPDMKRRPLMQTFSMPENLPYDLDLNVVWNRYVDLMRRFADVAEDAGLRYAIEPHPFALVSNVDAALRLFEHVGSKVIGMNWDPSHLFPSGDTPATSILKLKGRIFHTHISDNDGLANYHWGPGNGKIDWESCLKALKVIGYDYVLSLELHVKESIVDKELIRSGEFLKEIADEVGIEMEM